jgi:hypothetical protein
MGEVEDMYTQDGTVDMKGNPAVKKGTGNWRACPYILGQCSVVICVHCRSALCSLCLFVVDSIDGR